MRTKSREAALVDEAIAKASSIYPGKPARTITVVAAEILMQRSSELREGRPSDESESEADTYYRAAVQAVHRIRKMRAEIAA